MKDRNQYFLRGPVEHRLQTLVDLMSKMANEYKEINGVGIAYQICSDQLQKAIREIVRDDNHQIVCLKNATNMKMFEMVNEELEKTINKLK